MAEHNVKINVKTDTGYDQLYPKSKSDIIDFDKTNSNLSSVNVEGAIKEVNTKANTNKTNIGTLSSLTTDVKTNLVEAINEVDAHTNTAQSTANTNKTNIGTLSSLKTTIKNSIVNAINWLYDNVVHKTSVIDNLDDIVANQSNGMVAGALAVRELNGNFEKLVDGNKYSVSAEIDTGEVWHDGRKIYKRTFVTTESIVFGTPITIPITGVAMSEFWIDTQNSFISTASVCYPLPMVGYGGDPDEHIYVWLNSSGIRIGSTKGGWGTGWKKTVTIRYTKL